MSVVADRASTVGEYEMLASHAVRLNREQGMSAKDVGAALGLSTARVVGLWRAMRYDPVAAHADELREMFASGYTMTGALDELGITRNSNTWRRMRELGLAPEQAASRARTIRRQPVRGRKCAACEILIEPYNAEDEEQQAWGNGTRDGVHCIVCEERLRNGGGYVGGMPLFNQEAEPLNLDEVFGLK